MIELPNDLDLLNPEFLQAWDLIRYTNRSVFLTGKAGTGKSTFLRYICQHTKKNYVVLAPTGIAAMNVGGATLHSFFQIPMRPIPPHDPDYCISNLRKKLKFNKEKVKLLKALQLVIIDEISMVRADIIDFVDRVLRCYSDNKRAPFGGKQLLLVGDIFQLEPVITGDTRTILSRDYSNFFFFNAKAYEQVQLVSIELKKIYRQKSERFIEILDRMRVNRLSDSDFSEINRRYSSQPVRNSEFTITLAARRDTVDTINDRELESIPGDEFKFRGRIEGDFPEKLLPTDLDLVLKKNAQVIFLKNDKDRRWVNGTIGKIHHIDENAIMVKLETGDIHAVEPYCWENIKYTYDEETRRIKEEVIGMFTQFPIKAAWALTIHKSQGLTFNNVVIDLGGGGAFSSGQSYVALSRCTSLEGISLCTALSRRDVIVNPEIVKFSASFNDHRVVDGALADAKADILYSEALAAFNNHDMPSAVEKFAEAVSLRNILLKPLTRRLIASKLRIINTQQQEIASLRNRLVELAQEYVDMGGECLQMPDAWQAALKNFEKAISLDSSNQDAAYGKALALRAGGMTDDAITQLRELLQTNPKHFNATCLLGACHLDNQDLSGALLVFSNALKLRKNDPDLHWQIAEIFEEMELEDMAEKHRKLSIKYRSKKKK